MYTMAAKQDNDKKIRRALYLENQFLDEVDFRISSIFTIMQFGKHKIKEIDSFLQQLRILTKDNIAAMKKLHD